MKCRGISENGVPLFFAIDKTRTWYHDYPRRHSKFQFNTHPMFIITQIPYALTQNGILASRW